MPCSQPMAILRRWRAPTGLAASETRCQLQTLAQATQQEKQRMLLMQPFCVLLALLLVAPTVRARQLKQDAQGCHVPGFTYQGQVDFPLSLQRQAINSSMPIPFQDLTRRMAGLCLERGDCHSFTVLDFGSPFLLNPEDNLSYWVGVWNPMSATETPTSQPWVSEACHGVYVRLPGSPWYMTTYPAQPGARVGPTAPPSVDGKDDPNRAVIIASAAAATAVVVAAAAVGACLWWRRRRCPAACTSAMADLHANSEDPFASHAYVWDPVLGGAAARALSKALPDECQGIVHVDMMTDGSSTASDHSPDTCPQLGTPTCGSQQPVADSLTRSGVAMQPALQTLPAYQPYLSASYDARSDIDTAVDDEPESINIDCATIQVYEDQCLGHGRFGAVYGGLWMDSTPVAVKMLHTDRMNEKVLNALRQEAAIMCDITHPYIARVYGLVDDGQHHALVMSWYKNGSVSGMMAKGTYAELGMLERLRIGHQVACGMCSLHGRKPNPIIHGDLKTSNLLVENDGNSVVIADFGLAACLRRGQSGHVVDSGAMTLTISPPEVLADPTAPMTTAADIYAFGITLLEIVTGRPVYRAINREQLKRLVLSGGRPSIPVSVPPEVASIIRDCWAQQPQDRPSFAVVFAKLNTAMAQLKQQLTLTTTETDRQLADISNIITTSDW